MNDLGLLSLELAVAATGLMVLLAGLWMPPERRHYLGYVAAVVVGLVFVASFVVLAPEGQTAFEGLYVLDDLAVFFKRLFLLAACFVLVMTVGFAGRLEGGAGEFAVLVLLSLVGMMLAASAVDFSLLFVSMEVITVAFYILTSFERGRRASLEAGVKMLIVGGMASAFLLFGVALVFGTAGTLSFDRLERMTAVESGQGLYRLGLVLVFVGLGFKLAAVPCQMWAPDVYEGAPAPATAFLAVGSKAAGLVLLIRVTGLTSACLGQFWGLLLVIASAASILYGVLCAVPQRNLKRLMGYSSIAGAGYLLVGLAAGSAAGVGAALYYIASYVLAAVAAFTVICLVYGPGEAEDVQALAGLHKRAPLLAGVLALAMVSLAGVPPLAGFFGKFLLLKAALAEVGTEPRLIGLVVIAVVGVVISVYYYFGVIRAMYWSPPLEKREPIHVPCPIRWSLYLAAAGLFWLGLLPSGLVDVAQRAATGMWSRSAMRGTQSGICFGTSESEGTVAEMKLDFVLCGGVTNPQHGTELHMADIANKYPDNVAGKYFVDNQCIDCDLCRETAPSNFKRNENGGYSYVYKQPEGDEEARQCKEAKEGCPVEAIGDNGG